VPSIRIFNLGYSHDPTAHLEARGVAVHDDAHTLVNRHSRRQRILQNTPHTGEFGNIATTEDRFVQAHENLIVTDLRPDDFYGLKLPGLYKL
jgi:hypothetical protein